MYPKIKIAYKNVCVQKKEGCIMTKLVFEEVSDNDVFAGYTADCSGSRSDCCTRVCTRDGIAATEAEWGKFLQVEGGVIQY